MNKALRFLTRMIFVMFLVLFGAVTVIQFVYADELRANELNSRTIKNGYRVERGSIIVAGDPVAYSTPTTDEYRYMRQYADGPLYAPVTGYYSHNQGMTALEQAMNQDLSGIGNAQFFTRIMNTLNNVEPQGSSVETSIDPDAQRAALDAMEAEGFKGAVVALEPDTGRILAMVSTPSFDPNELSSNSDAEIIENYTRLDDDENKPLVNRAIAGDLYHPGSTYKLISAAAAIEAGEADLDTEYDNPASLTLPQSSTEIQNASRTTCGGGDKVTLERAVILSCNIPIAEMAMDMERDTIPNMAAAFGFGQEVSIPLAVTPSASPIPIDAAQSGIASIGQLDVRATPLQMAMVAGGIANDGTVMQPTLVDRVLTPDLQVESETSPSVFAEPISSETAGKLQTIMEKGVNTSDGAAAGAALEGVTVAGKTGTAENGTAEDGSELPFTLWFTGYAPAEDPQIAIAVVVEDGGGEPYDFAGNSYYLPTAVAKQVMEAVLNK